MTHDMVSSICKTNMSMLLLFIVFSIAVSSIDGSTCKCCFPGQTQICQTPAIELACADCTGVFCANHVKGCQGSPQCDAVCQSDSSTSSVSPLTSTFTTSSQSCTIQPAFFLISTIFTLFIFIRLNF